MLSMIRELRQTLKLKAAKSDQDGKPMVFSGEICYESCVEVAWKGTIF